MVALLDSCFKIATWNVNSLRARLPLVEVWLQAYDPDVLLLQETKVQDKDFPTDFFEDKGYYVAFHGEKKLNGVACIARYPIEEVRKTFPGNPLPQESRYLQGTIQGFQVASIYVPNGQSVDHPRYQDKLNFLGALSRFLKQESREEKKIVLGGDFNVAPYDCDVADPKAWEGKILCSSPEREALRALYFMGYEDPSTPWDSFADPSKRFTWWDYRGGGWQKKRGLRIDYCLLSPEARDVYLRHQTFQDLRGYERPSDHAPVGYDFKI